LVQKSLFVDARGMRFEIKELLKRLTLVKYNIETYIDDKKTKKKAV